MTKFVTPQPGEKSVSVRFGECEVHIYRSEADPGALVLDVDAPDGQAVLLDLNDARMFRTVAGDTDTLVDAHFNVAKVSNL